MAQKFGGEVHMVENAPGGRWQVLTESSAVGILLIDIVGGDITFTLPGESEMGAFLFGSDMWNPGEMSRVSAQISGFLPCKLKIEAVEFKMRTGITVLYFLPSIKLLPSGA
jgi:hypothetical protein